MGEFYVYCHVSPSGKKYVGISLDPEKRWNGGRGYIKNYRFWRAIKKYGWDNFQHLIIATNLSKDEAVALEIQLVADWRLTDFNYGYNLRNGGDGSFSEESRNLMSKRRMGNTNSLGRKHPDEMKQRISNSLIEYYSTHPSPMLGKKHSPETIARLKEREFSEETRRKMSESHWDVSGANNPSAKSVRQLSMDGEPIREYPYATVAAKELNIDLSSIIKCCRGKNKSCGGYRWEYI